MEKKAINHKRRARRLVLQALYQWSMSGEALYEIEGQFCAINNMDKVDVPYFHRLLHDILEQRETLEKTLLPYLDRAIHELNPIELNVLRLSAYELLYCPELPYRVVLDEAVSLAKEFGSQDGHRYVNGVLNNLAQVVRKIEIDTQ